MDNNVSHVYEYIGDDLYLVGVVPRSEDVRDRKDQCDKKSGGITIDMRRDKDGVWRVANEQR